LNGGAGRRRRHGRDRLEEVGDRVEAGFQQFQFPGVGAAEIFSRFLPENGRVGPGTGDLEAARCAGRLSGLRVRGPLSSTSQGIVSAINVTHSYMATKNPAPANSTNSAFGIITPRRKPAPSAGT
jgi:hypothetical protein